MSELHIESTVLREHAANLKTDAGSVGEGVAAAGATQQSVDGGAFGLMCSFLTPWVNGGIASNTEQLGCCQEILTQLGTAVGDIATDFETTEEALRALIDQVSKELA